MGAAVMGVLVSIWGYSYNCSSSGCGSRDCVLLTCDQVSLGSGKRHFEQPHLSDTISLLLSTPPELL